MTEETNPTPMLQDASTADDMRSLLTFARAQGPGQGDLDRLAKRLSPLVGVSVVDLAVPGSDLGLGTPPANPPGFGPSLTAAGKGALVKVGMSTLAKSIVAATLVSAGALWLSVPSTPAPQRSKPAPVQVAAPVREPVLVAPTPAPAIEAAAVEAPEAEPAIKAPAARVRRIEPKPAVPAVLPSEIELIRQAEDLRGQPGQALRALNEHARLYPQGMLAQEREVLAIEALLASGKRQAAEERADDLAAAHPGSAHLRRVRVLLGTGGAH